MEQLKIMYEGNRSTVMNIVTGKHFLLGNYANKAKMEKLAPLLLSKKLAHPSEQFKRFMNEKI